MCIRDRYGTPRGGGVYVSRHWYGSPATRYHLDATSRIVEIDGQPVSNLDEFLAAVASKRNRDAVRIKTLSLDGKPKVITLKLDLEYWPTYELRRTNGVWERVGRLDSEKPTSLVQISPR